MMGADVPDRDIEEILRALGFQPVEEGWRHARLACGRVEVRAAFLAARRGAEIDLIEEVARHYGYDKFPAAPAARQTTGSSAASCRGVDRLRERVLSLGYREIVGIPLVDPRRDELFRAEGIQPAVIGNPLAEDASVMRSMDREHIGRLEWNLNHGQRNLRLFEIGKAYELRDGEPMRPRC